MEKEREQIVEYCLRMLKDELTVGTPLVLLRLVEVDVERLGELVTDAWRMRAPDGLVYLVDDIEAQECFRGCGPRNC